MNQTTSARRFPWLLAVTVLAMASGCSTGRGMPGSPIRSAGHGNPAAVGALPGSVGINGAPAGTPSLAPAVGPLAPTVGPLAPAVGPLAPTGSRPAGAGVVANNSVGLIANNSGGLIGQVKGPTGLVDLSGRLLSNNAAGYRVSDLAQLAAPQANARVAVFDEFGNQISYETVDTDANGRYAFDRLKPSGPIVFVRATFRTDTRPVALFGVVPAPRAAGQQAAAVDLASTLVAKKVAQMVALGAVDSAGLKGDLLPAITSRVSTALGGQAAAAAVVLPKGPAAIAFDAFLRQDTALGRAVNDLASASGAGALLAATPDRPLVVPTPTPAAAPAGASGPTVSSLAGGDSAGYADGVGAAARFSGPQGLALDAAGNLYVADSLNNAIRRVGPDGRVTTLAGAPGMDYVDGPGKSARFSEPQSLAVGADGTVYVADTYNHCIRAIDPSGNVTTLAGSPTPGYQDGVGAQARFNQPAGLAIDAAGNLYVADELNQRIRKIDRAGHVTTLAGSGAATSEDGAGTSASFDGPVGIAVDAAGSVYVSENQSDRVRKISPAGVVSTLAGNATTNGFADGFGANAAFKTPSALALDAAGNLYVADTDNNRVRQIDPRGNVTTLAGDGLGGFLDGFAPRSHLDGPAGIAVGPDGSVYVCELQNARLRRIR